MKETGLDVRGESAIPYTTYNTTSYVLWGCARKKNTEFTAPSVLRTCRFTIRSTWYLTERSYRWFI